MVGAGSALGALSGIASDIVDYAKQSSLQENQYEYERKLAAQAYGFQRSLDYSTLGDKVRAMRDNGINPQSIAGDYSAGSAPQGHASGASAHGSHYNFVQDELMQQQTEQAEAQSALIDEQADLVREQARHQQIINDREEHADSSYSKYVADNINETLQIYKDAGVDTEMIANLEKQLESLKTTPANLGDYTAQMKAVEAGSKTVEGFASKIYNLLRMMIDSKQLQDDLTTSSIAEMPKVERELKLVKMSLDSANAYYLTQEGNYARENIKLIADQQNKLKAEVSKLLKEGKLTDIQARHIYENDTYQLISDGEYGKAARNVLGATLEKGADAASYLLPSKAAGSVLKSLSNTKTAPAAPAADAPKIVPPQLKQPVIVNGARWF